MKYILIFLLVLCIVRINKCLPHNSTVLISKYAKVAVWGRNKTNAPNPGEGRNHQNDRILNHRLDPKNIGPSTKKKNSLVAYQYPVYQRPDHKVDQKIEHVPGIGEVIVAQAQDRFEARPLFAYRKQLASATYGPPPAPKPNPPTSSPPRPPPPLPAPPILAPPASSFSSFGNPLAPPPPSSAPNPSADLYNSPYSSYNPPDFRPDNSGSDVFYPPNVPPSENNNELKSASQAESMEDHNDSAEAAKVNIPDSYASLGPPLASYDINDDGHNGHEDHGSSHDPVAMYKDHNGPPDFPPKSEDDIYYPPDFPKDQVPYDDHDNGDDMMKQPQDSMMAPPPDSMMQQNMDSGKANGDADNIDLAPPPLHDYEHGHGFPQYLYDHHHYDHHVYEEIPHTTMAPAKEDKRVSSTHYSYYYLGRKLWYIPLYFSIYFIIYVTVLILKSIARHKVRLKYKWYEHDTSAKEARSMDLDALRNEELTDLHRNVSVALQNVTEKYNTILAM